MSIILASNHRGLIGVGGTIPWPKNDEDMQIFREKTAGKIVGCGRKTFDSLPRTAKNRMKPIIISRSGAAGTTTLEQFLGMEGEKIIIGGAELYEAAAEKSEIHTMYFTLVKFDQESGPADVVVDLAKMLELFPQIIETKEISGATFFTRTK